MSSFADSAESSGGALSENDFVPSIIDQKGFEVDDVSPPSLRRLQPLLFDAQHILLILILFLSFRNRRWVHPLQRSCLSLWSIG